MTAINRMADWAVSRLVPAGRAKASDCQTDSTCSNGNYYTRTCCLQANGSVTCGPWRYCCKGC